MLVTAVISAAGYLIKSAIDRVNSSIKRLEERDDKIDDRLSKLEREYLPRVEFFAQMQALATRFDGLRDAVSGQIERILSKLDGKADRTGQ